MIVGDPYKLAFIIDRVPSWECVGFVNGVFLICINGVLVPSEIRTTTLNGDLFELLAVGSPIDAVKENGTLYQLETPKLFETLCDITYPQDDRDNDYRYLVPTRELNDAGYSMFVIGHDDKVKCLIGEHGAADRCVQAVEICKVELMEIVTGLKRCYHNILDLNQQ